ncbi:MAG: EamA family transporter [Spirochaetales bacterium]|nr:EamA family transporter [Spirochaetales bacterium]
MRTVAPTPEPIASPGKPARARGIALALVSAVTFSSLGLFAKLAYSQGMLPAQALAWRFSLAALVLWGMLLRSGAYRRPLREYRNTILLGLFGFAPQAGLFFLTVQYLDPGLASLLLYLYPAFVVGLSFVFLKRKPRAAQMAALLFSGAGCVLTLWTRGSYPLIGYVLGLSVAVTYAVYLIVGERVVAGLEPTFITANLMTTAAFAYWLVTLSTGAFLLPSSPAAVAGVVGIAIVGSVVPIVTLFAAIRIIGSADASLVSTVEPLFTVALSALFFGERLTTMQLAGGALIVVGVLMLNVRRRKQ